MTTAAWVMMLGTWSVVIFFASRFLLLAMRVKQPPEDAGGDDDVPQEKADAQE